MWHAMPVAGELRPGALLCSTAWRDKAQHTVVQLWCGQGMAWHDKARQGQQCSPTWHGTARHGRQRSTARHACMTLQSMVWHGMAWQGRAGHQQPHTCLCITQCAVKQQPPIRLNPVRPHLPGPAPWRGNSEDQHVSNACVRPSKSKPERCLPGPAPRRVRPTCQNERS